MKRLLRFLMGPFDFWSELRTRATVLGTVRAATLETISVGDSGLPVQNILHVSYTFQVDTWTFNHSTEVSRMSDWRDGEKKVVKYRRFAFPTSSSIDPRRPSEADLEFLGPSTLEIRKTGEQTMGTVLRIDVKSVADEFAYGIKYNFTDTEGKTRKNITWAREPLGLQVGSEIPIRFLRNWPEKSTLDV